MGFRLKQLLHVPEWRNGRRGGFKIRYPQGCGGSSPSFGISTVGTSQTDWSPPHESIVNAAQAFRGTHMAQVSYSTSQVPQVKGGKTAIIISKWYREYTEAMVEKCLEVLRVAGCEEPKVHVVPGSLEIPLAAKRLAENDRGLESIIVFGVILKGDTYHFEMVKDLANSGLERVMFENDIPIINEILPVDTIEYVKARCGDDDKNKGLEAGLAAVEIMLWRRENPKR